jgi:hypothetical protein
MTRHRILSVLVSTLALTTSFASVAQQRISGCRPDSQSDISNVARSPNAGAQSIKDMNHAFVSSANVPPPPGKAQRDPLGIYFGN